MHGIERFLQDFYNDFALLRVSYGVAYRLRYIANSEIYETISNTTPSFTEHKPEWQIPVAFSPPSR